MEGDFLNVSAPWREIVAIPIHCFTILNMINTQYKTHLGIIIIIILSITAVVLHISNFWCFRKNKSARYRQKVNINFSTFFIFILAFPGAPHNRVIAIAFSSQDWLSIITSIDPAAWTTLNQLKWTPLSLHLSNNQIVLFSKVVYLKNSISFYWEMMHSVSVKFISGLIMGCCMYPHLYARPPDCQIIQLSSFYDEQSTCHIIDFRKKGEFTNRNQLWCYIKEMCDVHFELRIDQQE